MSTLIPPTPAANKSAEQHQEPSEQDSFNHLLYTVLRLTSEQVQDLNDWMEHRGIPNVHEVIAQNFRKPHALEDNLKFITQGRTCYIQSNVMISLSLMITYIKHCQYSTKGKHFGPFTTSRLILKTMMSGIPHHLRKKYSFKHLPSLDLLPRHDPLYPQRHLNHTSPLPTSRRGLRGMQVPIPSSRMKGTTTPSFATSKQLPRHKD